MGKYLKVLAVCVAVLSFSSSYAMEARLSEGHNRTNQPTLVGVKENQLEKELDFSLDEEFWKFASSNKEFRKFFSSYDEFRSCSSPDKSLWKFIFSSEEFRNFFSSDE